MITGNFVGLRAIEFEDLTSFLKWRNNSCNWFYKGRGWNCMTLCEIMLETEKLKLEELDTLEYFICQLRQLRYEEKEK